MRRSLEYVHHEATGGTLDSKWDGSKDTAVTRETSIVPSYLERVRLPNHQITSATSFMKDSRDTTLDEQDAVANGILSSGQRKTILTTGTYLMDNFLIAIKIQAGEEALKALDKRIVLTGSAQPMEGYLLSDGGFNLGMSIAILQRDIEERLFLVMNGGVWDGFDDIRKDLTTATFVGTKGRNLLGYDSVGMVNMGGTMDFIPDGLDGMVPAEQSIVPHYLRDKVSMIPHVSDISPFIKGSMDVTPEDMDTVVDAVKALTNEHVLITAGLYRMRELQAHLQKAFTEGPDKDKKIVLTGSRHPLNFGDTTDAPFNLGYSLGKVAEVESGVHVTLNGMHMGPNDDLMKLIYTPAELDILRKRGVLS